MMALQRILGISSLVLMLISSTNGQEKQDWYDLFNGQDLSGWDIKITGHDVNDNYKHTFHVEDGILKVDYSNYESFDEKFGHIYYHQPFSYYKLLVEYRFVGEQLKGGASWNVRNSGVMLHSQSASSLGKDQHFPVSIEIQFLGGLGTDDRTTANVCTPGTTLEMDGKINSQHCINSTSKTYHGDQWVTVEALVLGDSLIQHLIDGEVVLEYQKPQIDAIFVSKENYDWEQALVPQPDSWRKQAGNLLAEGYIALQAESHPIHFRKVSVLNLEGCMDPKAKNYKSYYVKAKNELCKY